MPSPKVRRRLYWSDHTKTWHYEFRLNKKKQNGDTCHSNEKLARLWVDAKRAELKNAQVGLVTIAPALTLRNALSAWRKAYLGVSSDRHVNNVTRAIELHATALLDTPIDQITLRDLEAMRSRYLHSQGKGFNHAKLHHSEGGANKVLFHLRTVMLYCARHGLGPREVIKLDPLEAQEGAQGVVWPEQVQAFLAEARKGGKDHKAKQRLAPHSATALCLMLGLGLRENEALGFRIEWWDRRRQVYQVGRSKSRKLREVPIPEWLVHHLTELLATQGDPTRGLLLPAGLDKKGHQLAHVRGFTTKPVARCGAALRITGLTPHRLRATFATTHFEAGTHLSQIQQMMGHADPETTMGYIVQRPKDQAAAQERVAQAMGFKTSPSTVPRKNQQKHLTQLKAKETV